jgi:hypothetical protein
MTLSFAIPLAEHELCQAIATRAHDLDAKHNGRDASPMLTWIMDITVTHANGCPLNLAAFLAADDSEFVHDAFGIARHIDRKTGQLGDCFLPRFALPEAD